MIIKYRTKEDDRIVAVELTEKGRTLKDNILEVPEKMFCSLGMSESEALEFKNILNKMLKRYT